MPKWTEPQQKAIDLRDSNLLVSAAAGSGKTAVLVERIIKLIVKDKVDIDKLLIVTFTNAAAGEMRERILAAIVNEMEKKNSDEKNLRRQMTLLNKASITTLHSFCINVIRKNFHVIGIDPTFRIADITESKILIQESLEEVLEEEYEKAEDEFITLIESFSENKSDRKIEDLILNIYHFIQSQPYPYEWLKESANMFNIDKENLNDNIWIKTVREEMEMKLIGAENIIEEALEITKQESGPYPYLEALEGDLKNIKKLKLKIYDFLEGRLKAEDLNIEHDKFKSISKKMKESGEIDPGLQDIVKGLRDEYKGIIKGFFDKGILERDMDSYIEDVLSFYPVMNCLSELVKLFGERYGQKKIEKGILDFNDLEHFTLAALESEEVREELNESYKYIFIDEYQDSNIVQETIIGKIKREDNLFLVGDVKQSIYRFRLADPSLFIEKYNSYSKDLDSKDIRIDLSKNFRSRKEILDGVNFIFENIMSRELGEVDYTEDAHLYVGADYESTEDDSIEVNIIEKSNDSIESYLEEESEDGNDIDLALEEITDAEVEATMVADKIKNMIGKKTYDAKKGEFREIKYSDIVILFRAVKNWANVFEEVFTRENIPVYVDDNSGYFDVLEVKTFLNLLNIIDNKRQDLPLLSIMRSPIGGFTTEDLIKIRINYSEKYSSYYEALESYMSNEDDDLSNRLEKFVDKLDYWNEESLYLKLDEFMWKVMIDTGYYYYVGAMTGGVQRQANLRILVDRANQFESASINGLFNFIRFADKLQSASGDMGTAKVLGENEDVVRIMTIHKSKGLEFPVVICAGLGKQFNLMDMRGDMLLHKDLGLGPKYVDINTRASRDTLPKIAIKSKKKVENLSEEMRVLYVALTRAKDKLILVGSVKDTAKRAEKWAKKPTIYNLLTSRSLLDWICMSLFDHVDGEPLRDLLGVESHSELNTENESKWTINLVDKIDIFKDQILEEEYKSDFKEKLENFEREEYTDFKSEIDRRFEWDYPDKESMKIPSKISVSDIKKVSADDIEKVNYNIPSLVKMPKFLAGEGEFSSAEKGTIMHFVMQHLDFKSTLDSENIDIQIERMIFNELLTDEEVEVIDKEKISRFFESDIGVRMLKSDNIFKEVPFVYRKHANQIIEGLESEEDIYIQGIVDCYFEEDGDIVLVDYKTDYVVDDVDVLIDRYREQLNMYKEAIEGITERKVKESYIYSFNLNREVKVD